MRLLTGRDVDPPVFVGPGYIEAPDWPSLGFTMFASALDNAVAVRQMKRALENPHDAWEQFRLEATDYSGTEWACGWTRPKVKGLPSVGWPLTGALESLVTRDSRWTVCPEAGVELIFRPSVHLPMSEEMISVTSIGEEEVLRRGSAGRHRIEVLGSTIEFFHRPSGESLWATATLSPALSHPWAERFVGEPLRILFGQLLFPRLVARNFGDGTAFVQLHRAPACPHTLTLASLLQTDPMLARAEFRELYTQLLEYLVTTAPRWDVESVGTHRLTRYYEEIIQATRGSPWVLSMTLASTAEGLLRMMRPQLGAKTRQVIGAFKELVRRGVLTSDELQTWLLIRNAVMHGSLVSPWATADDEQRMTLLAEMVRRLTHMLIGPFSHPTLPAESAGSGD